MCVSQLFYCNCNFIEIQHNNSYAKHIYFFFSFTHIHTLTHSLTYFNDIRVEKSHATWTKNLFCAYDTIFKRIGSIYYTTTCLVYIIEFYSEPVFDAIHHVIVGLDAYLYNVNLNKRVFYTLITRCIEGHIRSHCTSAAPRNI